MEKKIYMYLWRWIPCTFSIASIIPEENSYVSISIEFNPISLNFFKINPIIFINYLLHNTYTRNTQHWDCKKSLKNLFHGLFIYFNAFLFLK